MPRRRADAGPDYRAAAELRQALRRLAHATEQITRKHRLTPRRLELLLFVQAAADAGTPATVTSLCQQLLTTQGSVTQLVNGATRAGLIRRTPVANDRRSHHLELTATGARRLRATFEELGPERDRLADIVGQHLGRGARRS